MPLFNLLVQGGIYFTLPILAIFVLVVILFIQAITSKTTSERAQTLIGSLSLFALVLGIFAQVLGLIGAFDALEAADNVSPPILAGGLKVSFIPTVFGLFTFLVGRLAIIVLLWRKKG